MKQLEQKIAEAAAHRQQAADDLKKKIDEAKQKGNLAEAGEMQQKLDKLMKQQQQAQQLQQLAQKLAEAQQNMQKGDQQAAAQAMQQMMEQLDQMSQDAAEGEMLDMAMAQLEDAKDAMLGEDEGGQGDNDSGGDGGSSSQGEGIGSGRGLALVPRILSTRFRDSQVKQKPDRGAAIITGEAEGPTIRGDVREAVKEEMAASGSEPADPLVIEQLPRTQRENAEEYFNSLRDSQ
jgi:hypothetical protein